jgi:meso-butanediol dehydrogenase/(S,S)-butanediol dehydrogenase/diacetyl reductase
VKLMRLAGKVALVTGAASGIGLAVTRLFREEGATVIAADLDEAAGVRLDVTSESDWEALFQTIDRLDILAASAGISEARPIAEMRLADWRRVMAVNLDGAFLGLRYAIPVMSKRSQGSIVLVSSASGIRAAAGASAYCASKAGVRMLTRAAALECKPRGIRVNCVSPAGGGDCDVEEDAVLGGAGRGEGQRGGGVGGSRRGGPGGALDSADGFPGGDCAGDSFSLLGGIGSHYGGGFGGGWRVQYLRAPGQKPRPEVSGKHRGGPLNGMV